MSSNARWRTIAIIAIALVWNIGVWNFETYQVWLFVLALYLAVALFVLVRRTLAVRRMVRALRRLDPAFRHQFIRSINSAIVGEYYDARLRAEGEPDTTGLVERYPFSPSDAREESVRYWTVMVIGASALATPLVWPHMRTWQLSAALVVVVLSVGTLVLIRRRIRHLDTVLEVSPFSLTEVQPDGTRRTITFNQPLAFRLNRWRGRIVLATAPGPRREAIVLDFDRLGFNRLLACVMIWGGFVRQQPAPQRSPGDAPPVQAAPPRTIPVPVPWEIPTSVSQYTIQRWAAALWPTFAALALVPLLHRLTQSVEPRVEPLPLAPVRVAPCIDGALPNRPCLDLLGDTVWIQLDGRPDSATILKGDRLYFKHERNP